MASTDLHENTDLLTRETREMHRALVSLIEELEAVDWYAQRVDASEDEELKEILAHNRDEEKEHACMALEWIRRHDAKFDEYLRTFLFRSEDESIVAAEHSDSSNGPEPTLRIGNLREEETKSS